jgi:hypothetical protein
MGFALALPSSCDPSCRLLTQTRSQMGNTIYRPAAVVASMAGEFPGLVFHRLQPIRADCGHHLDKVFAVECELHQAFRVVIVSFDQVGDHFDESAVGRDVHNGFHIDHERVSMVRPEHSPVRLEDSSPLPSYIAVAPLSWRSRAKRRWPDDASVKRLPTCQRRHQ